MAITIVCRALVRVVMRDMVSTGKNPAIWRRAPVTSAGLSFLLTGCGGEPPSPSMFFFGAYFPSWLLCVAGGIIGSVVLRAVFIRVGIDDQLPVRLLVYVCLAAAIGFTLALVIYGL